jgi:nitric oxide dioxygenase
MVRLFYVEDILPRSLSRETAAIVKSVAPAFRVFGKEILVSAYERMLADPAACALFGEQALRDRCATAEALAEILFLVAINIDTIDEVDALYDHLARRHIAEGITTAHYLYIGAALLSAIRDVLGEGASDRILDGWHDGFWYLTEMLMERTNALRQQAQPGSRAA